jgi:hypothetical protein
MKGARESVGDRIFVAIIGAVFVAICGYATSYLQQNRKDQLAFVGTQIEKLYGPLFALINANNIAWQHFQTRYWPDREEFFSATTRLKPSHVKLWRRWMREVFQPMNVKMEDAIVSNGQLLVGQQMPPMFLQFISHTEAYKAVTADWENEPSTQTPDTSVQEEEALPGNIMAEGNVSPICFPPQPDFTKCIVCQYRILTKLQLELQSNWVGPVRPLSAPVAAECFTRLSCSQAAVKGPINCVHESSGGQ